MALNIPSHRREKRGPTDRQGIVKLGFFRSQKCSVEDLSASGAKLVLSDEKPLPAKFDLILTSSGRKRSHKCVKRWQTGNMIGIEFLSAKIG